MSSLGLALSIYSFGYARGFYGRTKVGVLGAFYNALLLATTFVFIADNAFFFLVSWELMAMTAYFLVTFEHEQPEARHAGVLYFIMSHIGTGCIILGFLLLFQASGGYGFTGFHALGERMSAGRRDAAFLLFLAGFGVKAGIVPLHIWLPAAHPVAPSNVSALLSGVIIKSGIYGLTRVYFDFLGTPPLWWGVTVLVVGSVSALLGVLYALMDHDLKRLLAYHSIENIGIILMGLGAALMFQHANHPLLGAMALIAGLYHTINHALFKGLLFLGAGAVQHGWSDQTHAPDGVLLPHRRGGHFRAAAAQWLRQRMAHLPVVASGFWRHGKFDASDLSHQRRAVGADGRAGGRLFCQGLRHHLPRPAPERSSRTRARSVPHHAGWNGTAGRDMHFPRSFSEPVSSAV